MDTKILKADVVASHLKEEAAKTITLLNNKNVVPGLAAILIGDDPASSIYVKSKARSFNKLNCFSKIFHFDSSVKKTIIIDKILELNNNSDFHGILLQLPLPNGMNKQELIKRINPNKDVDCFHPLNQGYLLSGEHKFVPCTPLGCIEILKYYNIDTNGKNVVIIGRSSLVGKPLATLLSQRGDIGNATVTLCHSRTRNLISFTKRADILVSAVGKPNLINRNMIKSGAHLIDVGINRIDDNNSKTGYAIVGDIDFTGVIGKAASITPVPGGVGVMTVTMLLINTIKAALNQTN